MNYEKLYKNALENAKGIINYYKEHNRGDESAIEDLEIIFPELKESEDERIRKDILELVKQSSEILDKQNQNNMIDWLEKQGKQKSILNVPSREVILAIWDLGNEWKELTNGCISTKYGTTLDYIQKHWNESEYYLREKQDEQNKNNSENYCEDCINRKGCINCENGDMKETEHKVEPKFKVGDIIINIHYRWDGKHRIREITDGKYIFDSGSYIDIKEQNSWELADKVEPKFHEGDWIIDKQGIVHQIEKVIENVTNNTFGYDLVGGGYFNEEVKSYRLWTIADAKDGNVLYSLDSNRPFIYKERNGYEQATAYCGLNIYGKFFVWNTKDCIITTDKYIPATKEQHDTLLKAMADAGYTFDFEKKELKLLISNGGDFESNNSKQNPTWSEEDEEMIDKIIDYIKPMPIFFESTKGKSGKEYTKEFIKNAIKWLKSIKGRIQPQQKWTEEDENGFGETLWAINKARTIAENENDMGNLWYAENWLTSLKERLS